MCVGARLAEMHLGVDHAGQQMQPAAIDHLAGGCARQIADRGDTAGAHAEVAQPLAVMIDDGAALEDQVVGVGHAGICLIGLEVPDSAYVSPQLLARDYRERPQGIVMQAALLPDRGVVKVAGDDARSFLNGLVTNDMAKVAPGKPRFAALLTPQGKIIVDFIIAEAPATDGGGFFLDCPRVLATTLVEKLNFYKLRAKVICEDLSEVLGVMAVWDGTADSEYGLSYPDPRLAALGSRYHAAAASGRGRRRRSRRRRWWRQMPTRRIVSRSACRAAASTLFMATRFRTKPTWISSPASISTRAATSARRSSRASSIAPARAAASCRLPMTNFAPSSGLPIMAGDKQVGTLGSTAKGHGLALMRLDRIADALAAGTPLEAGGIGLRAVKPAWAMFNWPGEPKVTT